MVQIYRTSSCERASILFQFRPVYDSVFISAELDRKKNNFCDEKRRISTLVININFLKNISNYGQPSKLFHQYITCIFINTGSNISRAFIQFPAAHAQWWNTAEIMTSISYTGCLILPSFPLSVFWYVLSLSCEMKISKSMRDLPIDYSGTDLLRLLLIR